MATVGINQAGLEQAKQLFEDWRSKVNQTITIADTNNLASSLRGTESELTAKQLETALQEAITNFFTTAMKDLNQLDTVIANYKNNDASNTSFSDLSNMLKS